MKPEILVIAIMLLFGALLPLLSAGPQGLAPSPEETVQDVALCESVGGRYENGCQVY